MQIHLINQVLFYYDDGWSEANDDDGNDGDDDGDDFNKNPAYTLS